MILDGLKVLTTNLMLGIPTIQNTVINLRSKYPQWLKLSIVHKPVFFPSEGFRHLIFTPIFRILILGTRRIQDFKTSGTRILDWKFFTEKTPNVFFSEFYNVKLSTHFSIEGLMDWWKKPRGFSFFPPEFTNSLAGKSPFLSTGNTSTHSGWIFHCRVRLYPSKLENLDDHISPTSRWWWSFTALVVYLDVLVTGLLGSTGDRIDGLFHLQYL